MADQLPPGFRFYPTEEELISFYLRNKLQGKGPPIDQVIPVVDIYDHNPEFLPQFAGERCRGDPEQWFFFTPIQEKAARGGRPNRLTNEGFWKATGSPGYVYSSDNRVIGIKRTMVFYRGRAPNGTKTQWKMNEYIAIDAQPSSSRTHHSPPKLRAEVSLCRVYIRSKTMRSFDRRPSGVGVVNTQPLHVVAPRQPPHKISSSSSSSSSSHGGSSPSSGRDRAALAQPNNNENTCDDHQNLGIYNWDIESMVLDNIDEPWWDWEKSGGLGLQNEKNFK